MQAFQQNPDGELERLRDEAEAAFIARDVPGYMRMFSPSVKYKRANGTVLNYGELTADVERQMHIIPSIKISRVRESYEHNSGTIVEVVTQNTLMTADHGNKAEGEVRLDPNPGRLAHY